MHHQAAVSSAWRLALERLLHGWAVETS